MRDMGPAPTLPSNVEAEQAVLGSLMVNKDVYSHVADVLKPEHFHDPVHARIYAICAERIAEGRTAGPILLRSFLEDDEGLQQLGGPEYIGRLASAQAIPSAARDYADEIVELAKRRRVILAAEEARAAAMDRSTPIEDSVSAFEDSALDALADGSTRVETGSALYWANAAVGLVGDAMSGETSPSLVSGFTGLDADVRIFPGDFVVMGARPSVGKTALAASLAWRHAEQGYPTFFGSAEMPGAPIMLRILADMAGTNGRAFAYADALRGDLDEQQFRSMVDAAHRTQALPLTIHDAASAKVSALVAAARRWLRRARQTTDKTPVVWVDYLQLLSGPNPRATKLEDVSAISGALKALAREEEIVVIALAQLNRGVESREDKRPKLSDLRESGAIEQDAVTALFLYRDEYYAEREKPSEDDVEAMMRWQERMERCRGRIDIICAKQRMGPVGTTTMRCNLALNRFWED